VTLRRAVAAVRRAGPVAFALSLLAHLPALSLLLLPNGALGVAALVAGNVVTFALVRVLAAHRPDRPAPPADGPQLVPPVDDSDRRATAALRRAARLWRPAITLTAIQILFFATALLMVVGLGHFDLSNASTEEAVHAARLAALGSLPVVTLLMAFVQLAPQRIALEGDPRVLVAAAHSVRIARTAYGALFVLAGTESALAVAGLVVAAPAVGVGLFALAVLLRPFVLAVSTELYVAGPRLDVPAEFGTHRRP
jgi:hypothetical protein